MTPCRSRSFIPTSSLTYLLMMMTAVTINAFVPARVVDSPAHAFMALNGESESASGPGDHKRKRKRDMLRSLLGLDKRAMKEEIKDLMGQMRELEAEFKSLEMRVSTIEVALEMDGSKDWTETLAKTESLLGRDAQAPLVLREDEVCLIPGETVVRVEDAPNNARRIFCAIDIFAPVDEVWGVLTDYENLQNVVPSLKKNEVLERWDDGVRLKQVGEADLVPGVSFKARCTLDVKEWPEGIPAAMLEGSTGDKSIEDAADEEIASTADIPLVRGVFPRPFAISHLPHRDLTMQSVESGRFGFGGDFSIYQGVWRMQPLPGCGDGENGASRLSYAVELRPALPVPVALLEGRIASDLVANLKEIRVFTEAKAQAASQEAPPTVV